MKFTGVKHSGPWHRAKVLLVATALAVTAVGANLYATWAHEYGKDGDFALTAQPGAEGVTLSWESAGSGYQYRILRSTDGENWQYHPTQYGNTLRVLYFTEEENGLPEGLPDESHIDVQTLPIKDLEENPEGLSAEFFDVLAVDAGEYSGAAKQALKTQVLAGRGVLLLGADEDDPLYRELAAALPGDDLTDLADAPAKEDGPLLCAYPFALEMEDVPETLAVQQAVAAAGDLTEVTDEWLVNTLFFLAQSTDATQAQDVECADTTPPESPTGERTGDATKLRMTAADAGTSYSYQIRAVNPDTGKVLVSAESVCTLSSGIAGYYVIEARDKFLDYENLTPGYREADENGAIDYTLDDARHYLHAAAVDRAGNISPYSQYKSTTYIQDGRAASSYLQGEPMDDPLGFRGFGKGGNSAYPNSDWPASLGITNNAGTFGGCYVEDRSEIWMYRGLSRSVVIFNTQTGVMESILVDNLVGISDLGNLAQASGNLFFGAVYDGTYVWYGPYGSNRILRVNPVTKEGRTFQVVDNAGLLSDTVIRTYSGIAFDGTHIWMSPCSMNATHVLKMNVTTNVITALPLNTNLPAGSQLLSTGTRYEGCTFDGRYMWFSPFQADCVLRIDTTNNAMRYIPLYQLLEPSGSISEYYGKGVFHSVVFDGDRSVYFCPMVGDSILKIDTYDEIINANTVTVYPLNITKNNLGQPYDNAALNQKGGRKFASSTYDGRNVWLSPGSSSDTFVKFDTVKEEYTAYNQFTQLPDVGMDNVTALTGDHFLGCVFDGEYVWFIPRNSDRIVRLERYAQINGRVTDTLGQGIAGVTVHITKKGDAGSVFYTGTTDAAGKYTANVPGLRDYDVRISGYSAFYQSVVPGTTQSVDNIATGAVEDVNFVLASAGVLHVKFVVEGNDANLTVPDGDHSYITVNNVASTTDFAALATYNAKLNNPDADGFGLVKLPTSPSEYLFTIDPVIPSYYKLDRIEIGTSMTTLSPYSTGAAPNIVNFDTKKEWWAVVYIRPSTTDIRPHHWYFKEERFRLFN